MLLIVVVLGFLLFGISFVMNGWNGDDGRHDLFIGGTMSVVVLLTAVLLSSPKMVLGLAIMAAVARECMK